MIVDLRREALPAAEPGRTVVVGAGAAGLALALDLERRGMPVLVLESGGSSTPAPGGADHDPLNVGEVTGQPYLGLTGARARGLGGSTALWHGQCMRLHPEDLAARPWVPGSGWPLAIEELERWYPAAERWFGLSGRGYGAERWAEHPRLGPVPWTAERLLDDFTEYAPATHAGARHRRHLRRSRLVTVAEHATVARVLLAGRRAVGVEVRPAPGRSVEVLGERVVLCAGAVENARVLMLSDPDSVGLGDGRASTGRFLQDHPVVRTAQVLPLHARWLQDRYSPLRSGRQRVYPKVRLAPAAQAAHALVDAAAVITHEQVDDQPAMAAARRLLTGVRRRRVPQGAGTDAVRAAGALAPIARDLWRRTARGLSTGRAAASVWVDVWLEQVPDASSRVALAASTDPLGLPRAHVHWSLGETEVRTSRLMTTWVAEDLRRAGVGAVRELAPMRDDDAWRASVSDAWHPAGTTRASADPAHGVVDADGAVHGVAGLFVAGASTFPSAGYANPTLTIVALALRLGAHLAGAGAREVVLPAAPAAAGPAAVAPSPAARAQR